MSLDWQLLTELTEMELPLNQVLVGDCVEVMADWPPESVDLGIVSPPFFPIFKKYQRGEGYHYSRDFGEPLYVIEDASKEFFRVLKKDGAYCLNLGFSYGETGVLRPFYIIQRLIRQGWICVDTIIWHKNNPVPMKGRLTNAFEYIFVLAKTPLWSYKRKINYEHNVWKIPVASCGIDGLVAFPEELVRRCIDLCSYINDVVADFFVGSGTTCFVARKMGRKFIGIDINPDYVEMTKARLSTVPERL